ncbi:aminopeptidase N [Thioflexithrix psekupsensis]|uniref:Aminopeptidase N n=1 Tax=Thioflexithrix psekupsensis TaxID=1570016 RepID=A0A251XAV7_9GAMM|nr:aminopeptidase N [Thioflexithrix psekupsensis]OUD15474.1 aminopeptidase N [Thioflexithrix psekupsensis]
MNKKTEQTIPQPIYRHDYRQPDYWIDKVELAVDLHDDVTIVRSILQIRRNKDTASEGQPLVLNGEKLTLKEIALNGQPLPESAYQVDREALIIFSVPDHFELSTVVAIKPHENTELVGLYQSNGNYCTQCEAESFRRITYFLDRPDVMATYSTTISADKARYPVLLSNGNRVATGELENNRHWVRWEDPFRKPSYLFALVAGQLVCHHGTFKTMSGREIRLEIWVEPQNIDKCEHALLSLQKAMQWDEQTFGLEYDLDVYMIVAVNDFNMGAMENKGLNVFNSKFVLCRPDTATDDDYEDIEAVIAHEYFHNWTGNRVTCRDWFQLTLKEGLTVYRDQRFTADMTDFALKRIRDVKKLRTLQFAEDQGPMAHPIRPESYIEMNNFYTITVYEKGAEVVRLYETLLGKEGFAKGLARYFEKHDGQAVTCDDFRVAMAEANQIDLTPLDRWYSQAGTPVCEVRGRYDAEQMTYTLQVTQSRAPTPAVQPAFMPCLIPIRVSLFDPKGQALPLQLADENVPIGEERLLSLSETQQQFIFVNIPQEPVLSFLRGFSAPVQVKMQRPREHLAFLMAHDNDSFNRWDAGQILAQELLLNLAQDWAAGRELKLDPLFIQSFGKILTDSRLNPSLKAMAMMLPDEKFLGQQIEPIDVDALYEARSFMTRVLARTFRRELLALYQQYHSTSPYSNSRSAIDARRLKNTVLRHFLTALQDEEVIALIGQQFQHADNMTDMQAALSCLMELEIPEREQALQQFYGRWQHDPLVLDKWFALQASSSLPKTLDRVLSLASHPDFNLRNPNRVRSLIWTFCSLNQVRFHSADGRAYKFLAELVLELDRLNPQLASRLVGAFNQWRRFDKLRRNLMESQLNTIIAQPNLSTDVYEIVSRSLNYR